MSVTATEASFSNLVVKSDHCANLNPTVLFELAPIVKHDREKFEEEKKKIGYYGYDGVFVSIRCNMKSRGLRPPMSVKSFSDLDVQFRGKDGRGKNFHCKISRRTINIVGGESLEVAEAVCRMLYDHFEGIEAKWSKIRKLNPEIIRNTMLWYINYAKDMIEKAEKGLGCISDIIDWSTFPENCDEILAEQLSLLIDKRYDDINQRIADIYSCLFIPLYDTKPVFNGLIICNSVYNYRLPEKICLAEKSHILYEKGYEVSHHNWAFTKKFNASWTTPKGEVFNFEIQTVGTIKQNSGHGDKESIAMYEKLITDLGFIPYYKGALCAVKGTSPTSELPEKTFRTIEILEKAFAL